MAGFPFEELPEELIVLVFSLCDISAVISSSQTGKYLHRLALDRTVWVGLVQDLRLRGFIDRLSAVDISKFSTVALRDVVKRMITGQESWPAAPKENLPLARIPGTGILRGLGSRMSRTPRPRQSTLAPLESSPHFSDRIILRPIQWSNPPILLPGGRFIVYTTSDGIHCRDAESDVSIWSHYLSASASEVHSFGVEGGNATKNVKIVVCFSAQSGDNFVDILNLDLRTGVSEALLTVALPRLSVYLEPSIRGDIASIHSPRDHAYVLINWRATSCCRIRYRAKSELAMTLIPHHLVFAESTAASSSANAFAHIKICGIAALASYWYRTHDSSTIQPVSMDVLPTILTRSFILTMPSESPKSGRPQQLRMTVYESPLQNGLYRVWVYTPWSPTGATMRGSYHFNVLPGHITLRERDAFATKREWPWKGVSWYSGHRIALEGDRYCIFPPGMETSRESTLSGDCRLLSVSPYSGAIVYESKTALFISYFE